MNTVLTRSHKIFVILLCLMIHAGMLVTFVGVQSQNHADTAPLVMFEPDRGHNTLVEMSSQPVPANNALPATSQTSSAPLAAAAPQVSVPPAQPPAPAIKNTPLVAMNGFGNPSQPVPEKPTPAELPQPDPEPAPVEEPAADLAQAAHTDPEPLDRATFDETLALATQFLALEKAPEKQKEKAAAPLPAKKFTKQAPASPSTPVEKKKVTLAHITNRVLEQMASDQTALDEQNGGGAAGAAMMVKSNRRGAASMQQIMFVNYCKKILSCIVTSYRINKQSAPRGELPRIACIRLAITSDGKIHALSLAQSSGNPVIDQFILALFNDASSSFPPLPTALTPPLELPIFNIIALEQLQSAENWFIQ